MPGRRAGSPIAVYSQVQCREPKTGQEKVQFYCEDDSLFLSSYYLSMLNSDANIRLNEEKDEWYVLKMFCNYAVDILLNIAWHEDYTSYKTIFRLC